MTNAEKEKYLKKCTGCLSCKYFLGEDKYGWGHCILKEKDADKMFEELGYEKNENEKFITYKKQYETYNAYIQFNKQIKTIECSIVFEDLELVLSKTMLVSFNAQKIKAINEKVKELGWYD